MGDRGNIVVMNDKGENIYFYTHWRGSDLPNIVAKALRRGVDRWDDPPYLNRILFCELVKGEENENTGFGIDTRMGDGGTELYINHVYESITLNGETLDYASFIEKYDPS